MKPEQVVLELAACSQCMHPGAPMAGMFFDGGGDLVLTDAGRAIATRLGKMASDAIKGPAGLSEHRSLLFLVRSAFNAGDGEATAAAASMLGDVANEILFAPAVQPETEEVGG